MAKLLIVGVQVPDIYPENSPVEVVYEAAYLAAARAAGGMVQGKLGPASGGFRPILAVTVGPLLVFGGELGDRLPPLVDLTVKPRGAGVKGVAWKISGHPRDTGGGAWDGSAIGEGESGHTLVTEAERVSVLEAEAEARAAAQSVTDATLDLTAERARVDQALAEAAQGSIVMQQANQTALREAVADIRANATGTPPALARPVVADTFTAAQNWRTGPANGQRGYQAQAGTAEVNAVTGRLTVSANVVGGASPGVVTPHRIHEGVYRVLVQSSDQNAVLMWGGTPELTGMHYALWKSGGALEMGWWEVNGDKMVGAITSAASTPVPGEDYWIEVMVMLRAYVVRVWPQSGNRNAAQLAVVGFDNEVPPVPSGGPLRLASIGGTPAVYGAVIVDSYDRQPNPLSQKVQLVGPWFPVVEGQLNAEATITSGSELRCRVSGTPGAGLNLIIPEGMSFRPVIASRVREVGQQWSGWTRTAVPSNNNPGDLVRIDPVAGLDPAKTYDVQLCFNVQESDPLWRRRAGVIVQDVLVGAGGKVTALREPERLRILAIGDSITAGIVALGHSTVPNTPASTTAVLASEWSYLHVAADLLGAIPLHSGYGGTGITVPGEGGMPVALENVSGTMLNRSGKTFYPGPPQVILVNHGTNDDGAQYRNPPAKPTAAVFQAEYRRLCLYLLATYPAAMLVCMRPFNGGFWTEIQAVATELGLPTVDTTGWLDPATGDYASNDYTHPLGFVEGTDKGHRKAGRRLAAALAGLGLPTFPL